MEIQDDVKQFLDKVKKMEKGEKLDLSSDEDLSMAVMNIISLEEHLFFTYNKTGNDKYLDLLNEMREIRKTLLKKLIKDYEGEVWCICKHLLAASMRLMEVGTKALTKGDKEEAKELFQKSFKLYSLFWGLNLGLIKSSKTLKTESSMMQDIQNTAISEKPEPDMPTIKSNNSIIDKLSTFVQKMIDCCKE